MKYSADTEEHRKGNIEYINKRWEQLYTVQDDWGSEAIKYLLFVNSGAAAAILAFLGAIAKARDVVWPKASLAFFAVGIVLIGLLHAFRHYRVTQLFKKWRESANEYYTDQKEWDQVVAEDVERSRKLDWSLPMAYLSFACFIIGIVIAFYNFPDITKGEDNGRKETTISSSGTQTSGAKTTDDDKGRGASNQGSPQQPAAPSFSKNEIKRHG